MKNPISLSLLVVGLSACAAPPQPAFDGECVAPQLAADDAGDGEHRPAPFFQLAAFPDGALCSEELRGKVVVVDFWATWCQPCIAEIPHLNALHDEYGPDQFAVIGVTIESGAYEDIQAELDRFGIEYPVVMGDEAVVNGFGGVIGFPTKFVVTPDWTIYKRHMGGGEHIKEQIEQDIADLL